MSIAVVVVDKGRGGFKDVGMAIGSIALAAFAAPDIVEVPLEISQHDQVEEAVVIEIYPCRGGGPATACCAGLLADIGKRTVAVVMVEPVSAIGGHVEVLEAVVVVIANRDPHAIACALQAGLDSNVFERAVLLLVVKAIPIFLASLLGNSAFRGWIRQGCAIDEKDVEKPVVVIVQERHTGAHRLHKVFF